MNFGFENNKFYIEYTPCKRQPNSLRDEAFTRAREIYSNNQKVMLCLSSGLDSQIALVSFMKQDIPVECAFLRMGGYNDNELENVKVLEKKWGFKTLIIDINPNSVRAELETLKQQLDVHANHCLQYLFVKQLPEDYDIVQVLHDPWTITSKKLNQHFIFHGYYDPEIARYRALKQISRSGNIQMFGDSSEFFLSCISDELFDYFFRSWIYFDGNNLTQYNNKLPDVLRYEYYIKPMLYAKHWGEELQYFPKFSGYENLDWLMQECRTFKKERLVLVDRQKLINHLNDIDGPSAKFYELGPQLSALIRG